MPTTKIPDSGSGPARQLAVPVEIFNSIGMKLVLIPSGEFNMGSSEKTNGKTGCVPPQNVNEFYNARLLGELPQPPGLITGPCRLVTAEVSQEQSTV